MSLIPYINQLENHANLSEEEMAIAMTTIMEGNTTTEEIKTFLTLLSGKGETINEITAAARIMRSKAIGLEAPYGAVDCCGTGGDAKGTYNISTAVAIVSAACGVPMVKHGNRAASSKSGAADVLEVMGVNLNADPRVIAYALKHLNFAFFMAPNFHPAMKHVVTARKEIKGRTIFNILGPLANPAKARYQLVGVYSQDLILPFAETLKRLGAKRARIVHGADGLDEISISGLTYSAVLDAEGNIHEEELSPQDFDLPTHPIEAIIGGNAEDNAKALRALLEGRKDAYRDIVLANSAAVLQLHNPELSLPAGVKKAMQAIDSGDAMELLKDYIKITRINPEEHEEMKGLAVG